MEPQNSNNVVLNTHTILRSCASTTNEGIYDMSHRTKNKY